MTAPCSSAQAESNAISQPLRAHSGGVSCDISPWSLRNCSFCVKTFPNWSLQILHLVENYKWMDRSRTRWFAQACSRAADEGLRATVATRQMLVLSHFKPSAVAALSIVVRDIVPTVQPKTDLSNVTNDPLGTSDRCRVFLCKSLVMPRFVHSGCNFSFSKLHLLHSNGQAARSKWPSTS